MPIPYKELSKRAQGSLNTYLAKTGEARTQTDNDSAINAMAEHELADRGAELKDGDELSTNASFDKRIPRSKDGKTDNRGK